MNIMPVFIMIPMIYSVGDLETNKQCIRAVTMRILGIR